MIYPERRWFNGFTSRYSLLCFESITFQRTISHI